MMSAAIGCTAAFPDGEVWVRTHPVTYLHDFIAETRAHAWHQLTYAVDGTIEVEARDAHSLVPPDCAIWVPAGVPHREWMRAPVAVRTLYVAPGALADTVPCWGPVAVTPLLRELIVCATRHGALDQRDPMERRLTAVVLDQLSAMVSVGLQLRMPSDARARCLASVIVENPGARVSLRGLAEQAGASLRTLERIFRAETGMTLGRWRRHARMLEAVRRLDRGAAIEELAFELGYASASAFGFAFRREFGVSPTQQRRARPAMASVPTDR